MAPPASSTGMLILPSSVPTTSRTTLSPLLLTPPPPTPLYLVQITGSTSPSSSSPSTRPTPHVIVELHQTTHKYASWILAPTDVARPPTLVPTPNVTIATAVDPLFVALHIMHAAQLRADPSLFQPLCDILDHLDTSTPTVLQLPPLAPLLPERLLATICDVKHALDDTFYRLSEPKVLAWLRAKHKLLCNHEYADPACATDVLAQYLTPHWDARLREYVLPAGGNARTSAHGSAPTDATAEAADANDTAPPNNDAEKLALSLLLNPDAKPNTAPTTPASNSNKAPGGGNKALPESAPKASPTMRKFWARTAKTKGSASSSGNKDGSGTKRPRAPPLKK